MKAKISRDYELNVNDMVHIMISGTTGSGKSVAINKLIYELVKNYDTNEVGFVMIDPKQVELSMWKGIPHLIMPVVTNMEVAKGALNWLVSEMERRYADMARRGLKEWDGKQILVIVDELADLMEIDRTGVETSLVRLAQKARASGIHLVLATQSPRAEVLTGLLRANIPTKMSLRVRDQLESRIAIGIRGAEELNGKGDSILIDSEGNEHRFVVDYISDSNIKDLVLSETGLMECPFLD